MAKPRKTFKHNETTYKIGDIVEVTLYTGQDNEPFANVQGVIRYILREFVKPTKSDIKALYGDNLPQSILESINKPIKRTRIALETNDREGYLVIPVLDIKHLKGEE